MTRFSIITAIFAVGLTASGLPAVAAAAERLVAPASADKQRPAGSEETVDTPAAAAVQPAALRPDTRITEEADPNMNPYVAACDAAAADPEDTTRPTSVAGMEMAKIDATAAIAACTTAHAAYPAHGRSAYNLGRAEMARGTLEPALAAFDAAAKAKHPLAAMTLGQLYAGGVLPDHGPADALPLYTIAAEAGLGEAQIALGRLLTDGGAGVTADPDAAVGWFRRAAGQGDPAAAFELGWAFETGLGVPQDPITAARWYRKGIDGGDMDAVNNLGWLYANGKGVPRDEKRAVELYRQAAEGGVAAAMANLGWMLENGIGTPQDVAGAARWYFEAADLGEAQAMLNLGWLYLTGNELPADPAAALDWFEAAYRAGRTEALSYIGEIYEKDPTLRDPSQAATYYVRALEAGDGWPANRSGNDWDGETAAALQRALFDAGVYEGPFDSVIGFGTQEAMNILLARSRRGG